MTRSFWVLWSALSLCVGIVHAACVGISDPDSDVCTPAELSLENLLESRSHGSCMKTSHGVVECDRRIEFDGLRNVSISGNGLHIIFSNPEPGMGGIVLRGALNVAIGGFTISWDQSTKAAQSNKSRRIFSTGRVVSCAGNMAAKVILDSKEPSPVRLEALSIWDKETGWPWKKTPLRAVERYFLGERALLVNSGATSCETELLDFAGETVMVRHHVYDNNALMCRECSSVLVKNVTVTSAPGMGFLFWGGRDISLINNRVAPDCKTECNKPIPTLAADAAHFGAVAGEIVVSGNDFSMQGDDSLNITGWIYPGRVHRSDEANLSQVIVDERMRSRLWVLSTDQEVTISDLGLNILGKGRISSVDEKLMIVLVSTTLQTMPTKIALIPTAHMPDEVVVKRNYFHDHRGRGILVQAGHVALEDNRVERVTMNAIMLGGDTDYWFEGPGVASAVIRRNRIRQVNAHPYGDIYPSAVSAAFIPDRNFKGKAAKPIGPITFDTNDISEVFSNSGSPVNYGQGLCCNNE